MTVYLETTSGLLGTSRPSGPSVADFGAVADGVTDNHDAFMAAIALGGEIYVPAGTYAFSQPMVAPVGNFMLRGAGRGSTVLLAKAGVDFQNLLTLTALANVVIADLTIDMNKANRESVLTTTSNCLGVNWCSNVLLLNCGFQNSIGLDINHSGTSVGVSNSGGVSELIYAIGCQFLNNGTPTKPCDGLFMQGNNCVISDCYAESCTDTGFVLESCNDSRIANCEARNCGCGAALDNTTNTDCINNTIDGFTMYDYLAPTATGGMHIGLPANSSGHLRNTRISNVTIYRKVGGNNAFYVRKTAGATGRIKGITIEGVRIYDASTGAGPTKAMVIEASDSVRVHGCDLETTQPFSTIEVATGCTDVVIKANVLRPAGAYGIYLDTVTGAHIAANDIVAGAGTTHGVYFDNTCTNVSVALGYTRGVTEGQEVGSNALTTPLVLSMKGSGKLYTSEGIDIANHKYIRGLTSAGVLVKLMQLTNDANNVTRFVAGVDAGGFQWTDQAETTGWATLLLSGFSARTLRATQATPVVGAGEVGFGTSTATSATAGANGATPAQVSGYLVINISGTSFKVPYYAV